MLRRKEYNVTTSKCATLSTINFLKFPLEFLFLFFSQFSKHNLKTSLSFNLSFEIFIIGILSNIFYDYFPSEVNICQTDIK